jgi:hypothetical protein
LALGLGNYAAFDTFIDKPYKFTASEVPERRTQSLYADIVADFIAEGAGSVEITMEGMKPATLRAGLRQALKGNEDVKMAQRGDVTYLLRATHKQ